MDIRKLMKEAEASVKNFKEVYPDKPKEEGMKKKVVKRVRLPKEQPVVPKPFEGMTPGSAEWMWCWRKHPELQKDMLVYSSAHLSKQEIESRKAEEARKAEEKRLVEEYIKKHPKEVKAKPMKLKVTKDSVLVEDKPTYRKIKLSGKGSAALLLKEEKPVVIVRKKLDVVKKVVEEGVPKLQEKFNSPEKKRGGNNPYGKNGKPIDVDTTPVQKTIRTIAQLLKEVKEKKCNILGVAWDDNGKGELRMYIDTKTDEYIVKHYVTHLPKGGRK